jgi:hypothetical protein
MKYHFGKPVDKESFKEMGPKKMGRPKKEKIKVKFGQEPHPPLDSLKDDSIRINYGKTANSMALPEGWQDVFFAELAKRPIVSLAARKAGVARRTIYDWKKNEPHFAECFEDAMAEGRERSLELVLELAEKRGNIHAALHLAKSWNQVPDGANVDEKDKQIVIKWD